MSSERERGEEVWSAIFKYPGANGFRVIGAATLLTLLIAVVDLALVRTVALGFLYIIPLVAVAGFLKRWQIVVVAVAFSVLRESGSPVPWSTDYSARITLVAVAFAGAALFVRELVRNQQLALESVKELESRRQLEAQLLHSQRLEAVGRLAGGIAHDFNNLLSVIIGFSELALQQMEPGTAVRHDVEEVHNAGKRAATLTRQLLEFSRRDMLQPKVLDLNALVSDLSNMLRRLIGEDIDLHLSLQEHLSLVKVDEGSIEQVIMNLVVNARDAMPQGGNLTIQTAGIEIAEPATGVPPGIKPGRYVTLAVVDTGLGMERKVQEHLFEPFFTTKEVGKGTGLGLSTVYGIVKQNGGDIWFLSEKGQGTAFTIYLPPTEAPSNLASPEQRHVAEVCVPATVFLVEDDEQVRKLAREILERNGLTVVEARNGAEAVAISKRPSFRFDLLLTDVIMPKMKGPELAEKLSEDWPGLNVLFMTGYADPTILASGGRWTAGALIRKPLSEDSLMHGIRAALGQDVVETREPDAHDSGLSRI